jgi:alanyl-tRNA synthetase
VVSIANSIELCGGTHVKNTSEIEIFKIISEKSVAAGIRRIEAKTSLEAKKYLEEQEIKAKNQIRDLQEKISKKNQEILQFGGAKQEDINESDPKILEEILKKKDKEIERLKKQILLDGLKELKAEKIGEKNFVFHIFKNLDGKEFREIASEIKLRPEYQNDTIIALFNEVEGPALAAIGLSANLVANYNANNLIKSINGKGGGKPDFATAGGIENISQAIEILRKI